MIKVKTIWTTSKKIEAIYVDGHSKSDQKIDPICFAVSTVVLGALNAIINEKLESKTVTYQQIGGAGKIIQHQPNEFLSNLLLVIYIQLKTIEKGKPNSLIFEEKFIPEK